MPVKCDLKLTLEDAERLVEALWDSPIERELISNQVNKRKAELAADKIRWQNWVGPNKKKRARTQSQNYYYLKSLGLCPKCKATPEPGWTLCPACTEKHRISRRLHAQRQREDTQSASDNGQGGSPGPSAEPGSSYYRKARD